MMDQYSVGDVDQRISDQLVRLVQIVFGLVIAQSLVLYRDVLVFPTTRGNWLAALALATVYVTTVLSWVDWHTTMVFSPYNFNPRSPTRLAEQLRLGADLIVVTIYAYTLFSIAVFVGHAASDEVWRFLFGIPSVFAAYALSGILRRISHGPRASILWPILLFLFLSTALCLVYFLFASGWRQNLGAHDFRFVNAAFVIGSLILMLAYRILRWQLRRARRANKEAGLVVGFDLDGVLGNQIAGVLPKVHAKLGIELTYSDITDWALPVGASDIKHEIETAVLEDPDFVLKMPVHEGAQQCLDSLYTTNRIMVLTSRPAEVQSRTREWLERSRLPFDDLKAMSEMRKSAWATDVLVDDYLGNVKEYLTNSNGLAILVDQPWNQERDDLNEWLTEGRLRIVKSLVDVPPLIRAEQQRRTASDGEAVDAPS